MKKLQIEMKTTSALNEEEICSVINLKQQYWTYSFDEQKHWFDENIRSEDYHLFLTDCNNRLIAYLDAIHLKVQIDHREQRMLGIGNVCVDKKSAQIGLGGILMASVNSFIRETHSSGVLLCKKQLIHFYESTNWNVINAQKVIIQERPFEGCVMVYDPLKCATWDNIGMFSLSRIF